MFLLLLRILLWLILLGLVYFIVAKFIPKLYLASLGTVIILTIIALGFYNPNNILVLPTWEILSFPFKPIGIFFILMLLGVFKIKNDKIEPLGRNLIIIALVILFVSTSPIVAYYLARNMEMEGLGIKPIPAKCLQRPDSEVISDQDLLECLDFSLNNRELVGAIILLGKNTTQPKLPYRSQIQLNNSGDRILYTAQLYREQLQLGSNPVIIVSAPPRDDFKGTEESRLETLDITILLQELEIPTEQIITDSKGFNVRNSALETKKLLQERGLENQSIFLVTSGLEMRRASLTFSKLGLDIKPRPTDFYGFQNNIIPQKRFRIQDLFPSADALIMTTKIVDEFLATIYYFLRDWLAPTIS